MVYVIRYKVDSAILAQDLSIDQLDKQLLHNHMELELRKFILIKLTKQRLNKNQVPNRDFNQPWYIIDQGNLDWDKFAFSIVAKSWVEYQGQYFTRLIRNSGKVQNSKLIRQVQKLQFQMWEHRNLILYNEYAGLYKTEYKVIHKSIRVEFMIE